MNYSSSSSAHSFLSASENMARMSVHNYFASSIVRGFARMWGNMFKIFQPLKLFNIENIHLTVSFFLIHFCITGRDFVAGAANY